MSVGSYGLVGKRLPSQGIRLYSGLLTLPTTNDINDGQFMPFRLPWWPHRLHAICPSPRSFDSRCPSFLPSGSSLKFPKYGRRWAVKRGSEPEEQPVTILQSDLAPLHGKSHDFHQRANATALGSGQQSLAKGAYKPLNASHTSNTTLPAPNHHPFVPPLAVALQQSGGPSSSSGLHDNQAPPILSN